VLIAWSRIAGSNPLKISSWLFAEFVRETSTGRSFSCEDGDVLVKWTHSRPPSAIGRNRMAMTAIGEVVMAVPATDGRLHGMADGSSGLRKAP